MKFYRILTYLGLTAFYSTHLLASNVNDFPEAFAGLNQDAYHLIEFSSDKSNQLSFKLQGKEISIDLLSATKSLSGNQSFSQLIPGGSISATKGQNSLFGQMHLDNKHFILTTNQAGIWAVKLPEQGLHFNDCGMDHESHRNSEIKINSELKNEKVAGTVIDILMIYDQAIRDRYPGNLLQARVDQYLNLANQTFVNSEIDLAVRQVGLEQVAYDFDDSNENAIELLQRSLEIGVGTLGFENVPQLREQTGADLVIFLRTHNIEARGNCGLAYYPFATENGGFDISYGINIISDGMSSWSICGDQVVAHEIGHNLGAAHHNSTPERRFFPDGIGFAKIGQYGTVMGSFGTGQPDRFLELNYFSNPNVQCGGSPCGVSGQIDNANVMNQLKSVVANYSPQVSNEPLPSEFSVVLTDMDGDGVLDDDDEFPFDANESVDSDGDGVGDNSDVFPNDARETRDFDGDGLGDNSDPDADNDGIDNVNDRFPFNSTESTDTDNDFVGDNADELPNDPSNSKDADGDGTGNHADIDDDNDGVIDISADLQDLLVINVGNNRMLRFDAHTGRSKGIEVMPNDGWFTFQSDLVFDENFNRLYFTSESAIKSLDLMNPYAEPEVIVSAYGYPNVGATLNTGFPTALVINEQSDLFFARLRGQDIRGFSVNNNFLSTYSFPFFNELNDGENIIDIDVINDKYYFQGQVSSVYHSTQGEFASEVLGNNNYTWLRDPYALVATDDGRLLHSDQERNKIVITNAADGTYGGVFADLADIGFSNPTGMDITNDGRLLVAVSDQNIILEFNVSTGEFLGELVSGFGLDQPHKILLVPQLQDRFHEDADKVLRPNAGNWFNPASSGRGFNIGIFNNRLQVLWFTYDDDGNPIWYTAADFLIGHDFEADLLKTQRLQDGTVTIETVGQITLEFSNEREALMSWQIGPDSGEESIQWLQFSLEPDVDSYTGMWTRQDAPGWGTAVINNGDKTVVIPFIYDDDGEPRWVISDVAEGFQPFGFNMNTVFSDTLCPTCSGESDFRLESSGIMTFDLSNQPYWSSDLTWPTPLSGGWDLSQTNLVRISSEPTRPR